MCIIRNYFENYYNFQVVEVSRAIQFCGLLSQSIALSPQRLQTRQNLPNFVGARDDVIKTKDEEDSRRPDLDGPFRELLSQHLPGPDGQAIGKHHTQS
jgi:hypothetical protein